MNESQSSEPRRDPSLCHRRQLLVGSGVACAGAVGVPLVGEWRRTPEPVFVARGQRYDGPLATTIRDGLLAADVDPAWVRGRRVLLKPNLVEPTRRAPHIATHPAVVVAAAEVFRGWGADVVVGEAPGHVRDTEMALIESGLAEALADADLPFADLNYEDAVWRKNVARTSRLSGFWFPRSIHEADLIVSLPKMKTHHWVGVTASLKNLYGTLPGLKYGWPKNVLHFAGIPQTVVDINSTLPNTLAIVDGITCMEGDGPILGTPKPMGLLVIGRNLTAVDATCCRLMDFAPRRIPYLALAHRRLGPLAERAIAQRGEDWRPLAQRFEIIDKPHLRGLRAT